MAELPDSIIGDAPAGERLNPRAVAPTDFGLGEAGAAAGRWAETEAANQRLTARIAGQDAQKRAVDDTRALGSQMDAALATDYGNYGGGGGFGVDQNMKLKQAGADWLKANPGATPLDQMARERAVGDLANRYSDRANTLEAGKLLQQADTSRQIKLKGNVTNGFLPLWGPANDKVLADFNPEDGAKLGGYLGQAFDDTAKAYLETVPEQDRTDTANMIGEMRPSVVAQGMANGHAAQHEFQGYQIHDQISTLGATVYDHPDTFRQAVSQVPGVVAALPWSAEDKEKATREANAELVNQYFGGLESGNRSAQIQTEMPGLAKEFHLDTDFQAKWDARAASIARQTGPAALANATLGQQTQQRIQAEIYARMTTGQRTGLTDAEVTSAWQAGAISADDVAKYQAQAALADKAFAVTGPIHEKSQAELGAIIARPEPDPATPDYANALALDGIEKKAASDELQRLANPGAWAMSGGGAPAGGAKAKGAVATAEQQRAKLHADWQGVVAGDQTAGASYAGAMVKMQDEKGIDPGSMQIADPGDVARMAAAYVSAPPENKRPALLQLTAAMNALPRSVTLGNQSVVSPQAMFARQLVKAGMTAGEVQAAIDYGGDPAKTGRYVAALGDTVLRHDMMANPAAYKQLRDQVVKTSQPFLDSLTGLPDSLQMREARVENATLVAAELKKNGLSSGDAARVATMDLGGGEYKFVDGWRIPQAASSSVWWPGNGAAMLAGVWPDGAGLARYGAAEVMRLIMLNHGDMLAVPSSLNTPGAGGRPSAADANAHMLYASKIVQNAHWVTRPDDSGLTLMVQNGDGTSSVVADKYRRPISASWAELQNMGTGGPLKPAFLKPPPPTTPKTVSGTPAPQLSWQQNVQVLNGAIERAEGAAGPGVIKGPDNPDIGPGYGPTQVLKGTAADYATRVTGAPLDMHRLETDVEYGRKLGRAHLADMAQQFGPGWGGALLATVAHVAGPGYLKGFHDKQGVFHPGWLQTIGDPRQGGMTWEQWVARLPPQFARTRKFTTDVMTHYVEGAADIYRQKE